MLQSVLSVFIVYRCKTLTGLPDPTHANGTDKPCIHNCRLRLIYKNTSQWRVQDFPEGPPILVGAEPTFFICQNLFEKKWKKLDQERKRS